MPTSVAVTREVLDWLEAALAHGAVTIAADGSAALSPSLTKLAAGIQEVLAGGDVDVTIKIPGDPVKRAELQKKFDAMFAAVGKATPVPFAP